MSLPANHIYEFGSFRLEVDEHRDGFGVRELIKLPHSKKMPKGGSFRMPARINK
jgi:hypothetical protein